MTENISSTTAERNRTWSLWERPAEAPRFQLTARDEKIVEFVFRHRFLTPSHLHVLLGGSKTNIARRCRLLFQARFLERPRAVRPLKILNEELVYGLGKRGARLLQDRNERLRIAHLDWTESPSHQDGMLYIDHQLRIADVMTTVAAASERRGVVFHWDGHFQRRRYKLRPPGSDRRYLPDAVFSLSRCDTRVTYFLEADRGNVSTPRMRDRYLAYFRWWRQMKLSGQNRVVRRVPRWQREISRLRIVTITKSPAYMNKLRAAAAGIGRNSRHNTWRALMFSHYGALSLQRPETVFESIFYGPASQPTLEDETRPLFQDALRSS